MSRHRYILEQYKGMNTRYVCPDCKKQGKTFVRYIDTEKGQHVAPNVGRCNRESKCGYHYTPKQYFEDRGRYITPVSVSTRLKSRKQETPQPVTYIPAEVFRQSLLHYEANHFITFLTNHFRVEITRGLIERYFIGTSKHYQGATVFWQLDLKGRIRTGKIMQYNPDTGKRVKNRINWVHTVTKQPDFNLKQCLFGEHLLKSKTNSVAIVESEKTCLIASVYLPQFIWLAVGSLTNLTAEKCRVLHGRNIILYPDLNGFEKWSAKAKELSHLARFTVSDLLERKATVTEKAQGLDLADYLLRFDFRDFAQPQPAPLLSKVDNNRCQDQLIEVPQMPQVKEKSETWDTEITDLVQFFETSTLPSQPVKMNKWSTITNVSKFTGSHLDVVRAYNGNRTFEPYLNRLKELRIYLQAYESDLTTV